MHVAMKSSNTKLNKQKKKNKTNTNGNEFMEDNRLLAEEFTHYYVTVNYVSAILLLQQNVSQEI